ncbi:MAG TPA: DNA-3-methyladenine glycosylase I [Chthonomonadales bacterium]|nr:DNA-3-methyladenine glycosylase I [Chthonomonadales bacterium]
MSEQRCEWANSHPLMAEYHDTEWGVPVYHDERLFEFLVLESAQAGLSWITILKRREGYRTAFAGFDPQAVAAYTAADVERLLLDSSIIRNRAKIEATIANAAAFLKVQQEFGSFHQYMWGFVDHAPVRGNWSCLEEIPAATSVSVEWSKDLKRRGFRFLGPTVCYAHMQAVGMVNDHVLHCFRHSKV